MGYSDVAQFEVPKDLVKRLGYKNIYTVGRELILVEKPQNREVAQIVVNKDPGILINGLRDINVVGIVFGGDELVKKVVEKARELRKIVFIPVGQLTLMGIAERGPKIGKLRKIIFSSHKLGAKMRLVTLADSKITLLSTEQMKEIGKLLCRDNENVELFGEIL